MAGALMLIFAYFQSKEDFFGIWKKPKDRMDLVLFGVLGMLAVQYTYFAAIQTSNAATATVLQYLGPVMIAIYYAGVERRLPVFYELLALGFAVAGTFLMVTHGSFETLSISWEALFWGLASAAALASYSVQPVNLLKRFKSAVVTGWGMMIGGLCLMFVYPPWKFKGVWDVETFAFTSFIIVFGSLIAFYAYMSAVKRLGAQKTSLLACAEPLSAAVVAVLWLKVDFGIYDWIGTALILTTILLLTWKEARKAIKPSEQTPISN